MTAEEQNARLHRIYAGFTRNGPGRVKPYACGCGERFEVSDERREHRLSAHKRKVTP